MTLACTHLNCEEKPYVRVSGGRLPSEYALGWSGTYCQQHVLDVVKHQLFQVPLNMSIRITKL